MNFSQWLLAEYFYHGLVSKDEVIELFQYIQNHGEGPFLSLDVPCFKAQLEIYLKNYGQEFTPQVLCLYFENMISLP